MGSERQRGKFDGRLFVACMFIGLGFGMVVGEPGAGIILGMGVGFILGSLFWVEPRGITISLPPLIPGAALFGIGAVFTAMGIAMLYGFEIPWHVLVGFIVLLLGVAMMVGGAVILRQRGST